MTISCNIIIPLHLGAIDVTTANMYKSDRISTDEIYVLGFVPSHQLPKARPCALDPFLHPLVTEIEDIFIDGNYAKCCLTSLSCQ